jgi:hypothetical protein
VPGDRRPEREGAVKIRPPGHFGGVQRLTDRRLTREMHDEIGTHPRNQRVDRRFVDKIRDGRGESLMAAAFAGTQQQRQRRLRIGLGQGGAEVPAGKSAPRRKMRSKAAIAAPFSG